jgi:hypothetical protein
LLHDQRRIGKSSVIRNIPKLVTQCDRPKCTSVAAIAFSSKGLILAVPRFREAPQAKNFAQKAFKQ